MTKERRQDIAFAALAVSIAVHVAVMMFMRPQIMTRISGAAARERRFPPMRVEEAPPPETLAAMDAFADAKAEAEFPAPEPDERAPSMAEFAAPEVPVPLELPPDAAASLSDADMPAIEFVPRLSEDKLKTSSERSAVPSPAVPEAFAPLAAAVAGADSKAPAAGGMVPTVASFAHAATLKPEFDVKIPEPEIPDDPSAGLPDAGDLKNEVMDKVDEKIVEQEKSAVRDLLDDRNAAELSRAVKLSVASETAADGWTYFKVEISPLSGLGTVPKDIVFLLDASGSIGTDRLRSCRDAVRSFLRSSTNTGDRFNLVAFRDRFSYAFNSWRECDSESFEAADRWFARLVAHGRTDVFATIRSVLALPRDPKRPLIALVVTDGDANAGVSRTADILSRFTALNDGLVSIYMYGVKESANRELIGMLTRGNRGESYIFSGDRAKAGAAIEAFGEKFRDPLLTDLRVIFPAGDQVEMYPRLLKNLYAGDTVVFTGRVPAGKTGISFSLKGLNGADAFESFYSFRFADVARGAGIPEEWKSGEAVERRLGK